MDDGAFARQQLARERLTHRYGNGVPRPAFITLTTYEAFGRRLTSPSPNHPATPEDIDDALSLTNEVQLLLDRIELSLLDRARAGGRTWDHIAAARGYADRRQAQQRYRQLRERLPCVTPTVLIPQTNGGDTPA